MFVSNGGVGSDNIVTGGCAASSKQLKAAVSVLADLGIDVLDDHDEVSGVEATSVAESVN